MDKADTHHYATIEDLAPIFALPGVEFVNLMYAECGDEIAEADRRYGVTIRTWEDIDLKMDQEGVASLIANLDLVVSQPSAVSELAGALGVPAFIFCAGSVYVWLGTGTDVWHPNSRCFGKDFHASWVATFDDMAGAIREKLDLDA